MTAPSPTHGCFVVLERLPGGRVRVRCVCGNVKDISRQALSLRPASCGDWTKHEMPRGRGNFKHGCSRRGTGSTYVYAWGRKRARCAGWADIAKLCADLGERQEGKALVLAGDVVRCGACQDCRKIGAVRNVEWVATGGAGGALVVVELDGERVSQSEAGRRLGVDQSTIARYLRSGRLGKGQQLPRSA